MSFKSLARSEDIRIVKERRRDSRRALFFPLSFGGLPLVGPLLVRV